MFGNNLMAKAVKPMMLAGALAAIAGVQSAQAAVNTYNVMQTYDQVVYNGSGMGGMGGMGDMNHPTWDTIFTGSFSYDTMANTVSNLTGSLSQAMTGNTSFVSLSYQLSSVPYYFLDNNQIKQGFLVSAFHQNTTDVFQGGGFATGGTKEFLNQNAYITIFFNPTNPLGTLTQQQVDKLAYGDCTTGSLMGMGMGAKTCMTGWVDHSKPSLAGGTMSGTYPITQTIAAVPEPETYAMMMAGLGLLGFVVRRRRTK